MDAPEDALSQARVAACADAARVDLSIAAAHAGAVLHIAVAVTLAGANAIAARDTANILAHAAADGWLRIIPDCAAQKHRLSTSGGASIPWGAGDAIITQNTTAIAIYTKAAPSLVWGATSSSAPNFISW